MTLSDLAGTDAHAQRGSPPSRASDSLSLFRRWREDGDRRDRAELIERHLPLARRLASRYSAGNESVDDLVQVACVGLVNAVDRYDPDRGLAFSSFAVPTILGELRRHFRDRGWAIHVPRGLQERAQQVERAAQALASSGRAASLPELARHLGWSLEGVVEALEAATAHHARSLDAIVGGPDEDGVPMIDTIGDADRGYERVEDRLSLETALPYVPWIERQVIDLKFTEGLTQQKVGERLGMSQMQVSRLQRSALARLRSHIAAEFA